jgi:hypothetical protein
MTSENRDKVFWKEWQDILLTEFENRLTNLGVKGQGIIPARKNLTILFLQAKGFSVPAADVLAAVIRTIKAKDTLQPDIPSFDNRQYDTIAMIGHRIGMVDNNVSLRQYLRDVRTTLKPEGQILLTSLDIHDVSKPEHRKNPVLSGKQYQQVDLIGPFFHMWRVKADTLKSQAVAANWHCEFIYRQDDSNYFIRLSLAESEYPD